MAWIPNPVNLNNGNGSQIRLDLIGPRNDLLALPVNLNKDITGLTYKFGLSTSDGTTIFQKDLTVIDVPTGKTQLTITKNTTIDERSGISEGCYTYAIVECVDATGGDANTLFGGSFNVLDETVSC